MTGVVARWPAAPIGAVMVSGLLGCASVPPPLPLPAAEPPSAAVRLPADPGLDRFEKVQKARAEAAAADGHWAEAALAYEGLALVHPDDPAYAAALEKVRQRIATASAEQWALAEAARRRTDWEAAARAYLQVLAIDPGHLAAADALRAVERERNRRSIVGRFSRQVLARRGTDPDGNVYADTRNQIEHATLLARQGDVDAAITLLKEGMRANGDSARKSLLADLYVQRAESLRQQNPQSARTSVDAALALDPNHPQARALARQLAPARRVP